MYKSSCAIQHDEKEAEKFGDYIGKLVHEFFENQLPNNKGKPQSGREWTIISAVIMESIIKQQSTAKVLYGGCSVIKKRGPKSGAQNINHCNAVFIQNVTVFR